MAKLIDWTQPIETLAGEPCEVVEIDDDPEFPARVRFPSGGKFWLSPFGHWTGASHIYAVRNIADPARQTTDREDGK